MIIGVNTLYNALLNAPGFAGVATHGIKMANAGGMAVQRAVAEKWKQVTGVPIVESYGLTETSPARDLQPPRHQGLDRNHRRADSVDRSRDPG